MPLHLKSQAQIKIKVQVGALLFNETSIEVPAEYSNYSNIFPVENVAKLPKNTEINEHAIKLEKDKQLPFGPIYNLDPVKLKMLKTYIKTNLANGFIHPLKSPAGAPTLFDWKSDGSLCLCVDHWALNNITIKN